MDYISLIISLAVLTISGLTFWMTRLKNGKLKMTRPTMLYFGPEVETNLKKVFIKTLLYSTSDKGNYVQYMYVRLQRGESVQNFNIWTYDSQNHAKGSGLFVSKNGIACNHDFLMPKDGTHYNFLAGDYLVQVFVESVDGKPKKVFEQGLTITKDQAEAMKSKNLGLYFDWAPSSQQYVSRVDVAPRTKM
ncbi:hypothetical protein HME9304_03257 [Flagellimonas maritima]|uniref:Uncharacterized protein n=1 Tax=Flagellimonas maritima TaxID=1383885 RepID=A0A2Z4LW83_9FLAO|nr:hypothetical protein [Allomuricauda aurantiaca]AWX46225.1 hypothetical protein HME9304_03257 [Allomuricauda aurantiaca]